MTHLTDAGMARLDDFLERVGDVLGHAKRRASFATYALGLLSDGERKSVEPIAARACGNARDVDAAHQRLLHFLTGAQGRLTPPPRSGGPGPASPRSLPRPPWRPASGARASGDLASAG